MQRMEKPEPQTLIALAARSRRLLRHALPAFLVGVAAADMPPDPVAALDRGLATGDSALHFDPVHGYLPSLLEELDIPRSSQLLVFSKTSAQFRWIGPGNPRAIYFNDDTYVGWVPGGPSLEISTAVPGGGAAFYTLSQRRSRSPRLAKDNGSCLQCHESARTLGVPGHLTRSVYPAGDGLPHFGHGTINVDHSTPISRRWGGWFVSGRVALRHRGNAVGPEDAFEQFRAGSLTTPYGTLFDPGRYLTPFSDVVAHLVLAHQTRVHNSIARAGIEARKAISYQREMERLFGEPSESLVASVRRRIERPAEQLVRDLLLVGEARLPGEVRGESGFTEEFRERSASPGWKDPLRELDLESRLLRVPCSYLIRTPTYAALPERVRRYIRIRFEEILSGEDDSKAFKHLAPRDRGAILKVLQRSPGLP